MNHHDQIETGAEPLETVIALRNAGWPTLRDIAYAAKARLAEQPLIGQLPLKNHKMTTHRFFDVLLDEAADSKFFGQIAVEQGYVTPSVIGHTLYEQQFWCTPLWQQLVARGLITRTQAEAVRTAARKRLRRPLGASPAACEA